LKLKISESSRREHERGSLSEIRNQSCFLLGSGYPKGDSVEPSQLQLGTGAWVDVPLPVLFEVPNQRY